MREMEALRSHDEVAWTFAPGNERRLGGGGLVTAVVDAAEAAGLARKVARLTLLICVKG